VDPEYEVGGGG